MASMIKCPYCGKYQGSLVECAGAERCECGSTLEEILNIAEIDTALNADAAREGEG